MSMIPIVKLPHPTGAGKCYPLSVYESIVNTAKINVANNIGGYRKGDEIEAETNFDTIFRKIMEVPEADYIVTNFNNPTDETVPSSKLTKTELDKLAVDLSGKENVGVAATLVDALRNGEVKTNTQNITNNTEAITIINSDKDTHGSIAYAVDQLEFGKVKTNSDNIATLQETKQDKLVWASTPYDSITNPAITSADLKSTTEELEKKFAKVTNFRGIFEKIPGKSSEETLKEKITDPKNGDFAIVDSDEFIYADQDTSWHLLGNLDGYIKQGTKALRNTDFDTENHKITQDAIEGLADLQNDVTTIKNTTLPNLNERVTSINNTVNSHTTAIDNRYTKEETDTNINSAKGECNTHTNNSIAALDYNDVSVAKQFVSVVTETDGIIDVQRRSLISDDLPIATSTTVGAIKPGNNLNVEADGTLNIVGGSGGVGNVTGPESSVNNRVVTFNGTTGKLIKDSGFTISKSVPEDAKFTDTTYSAATSIDLGLVKVGSNITNIDGSISISSSNIIGALGYTPADAETAGSGDVTGPSSSTANHIATFSNEGGKLIKDSGYTIDKSVPSDAIFTDTTYTAENGITIDDSNVIKHTNTIEEKTTTVFVKITYDANGHITSSQPITAEDIPTLTSAKISDLGPYATKQTLIANDITDLGPYATKTELSESDIPDISSTKVIGLGKFATAESLTVSDIPNLTLAKITDAGVMASKDSLTINDIPTLTSAKISDLGELALLNRNDLGQLAYKNSLNKNDVGLSNVDDTSDIDKPISTAVQNALNLKEDISNLGSLAYKDSLVESDIPIISNSKVSGLGKFATAAALVETDIPTISYTKVDGLGQLALKDSLNKTDVGLNNVDNTSDANKPISTATQTALDLKEDIANLKALAYKDSLVVSDIPALPTTKINGLGELAILNRNDLGSLAFKNSLTESDIPTISNTKVSGLGKFATATELVEGDIPSISSDKVVGLGKFATASSLAEEDIPTISHTKVSGLGDLALQDTVTKQQVGLGNVDNTSDADKPVSTAQAAAINALKFAETEGANLTNDDGIIDAVKAILLKLGMKNEKIIIK